jgi:hypothetical protein
MKSRIVAKYDAAGTDDTFTEVNLILKKKELLLILEPTFQLEKLVLNVVGRGSATLEGLPVSDSGKAPTEEEIYVLHESSSSAGDHSQSPLLNAVGNGQ